MSDPIPELILEENPPIGTGHDGRPSGKRSTAKESNAVGMAGGIRTTAAPRFQAALHGLRGLLALWVVGHHTSINGFGAIRVTAYGYLAVDLFFIMSGFILMHAHHQDFRTLTWQRTSNFMMLRWWRIYPVHFGAFALALALTLLMDGRLPPLAQLAGSLIFLNTWPVHGSLINVPIWSLQVEWIGYFAFPLLAFVIFRLNAGVALVALVSVTVTGMLMIAANDKLDMNFVDLPFSLVRMAMGFVAGCLLWVMQHRAVLRAAPIVDAVMIIAVIGMVVVLMLSAGVYSFPLMLVIVLCAALAGPLTKNILTNKISLFLGRISFSLYMCHYPIVRAISWLQPTNAAPLFRLAFSAGVFVAAIGLATILCVHVEEPSRRYGRSLVRALSKKP